MLDLKLRGFEKETREEIKMNKLTRADLLDENISMHRRLLQSHLPGMVEDLNESIKDPQWKVYL